MDAITAVPNGKSADLVTYKLDTRQMARISGRNTRPMAARQQLLHRQENVTYLPSQTNDGPLNTILYLLPLLDEAGRDDVAKALRELNRQLPAVTPLPQVKPFVPSVTLALIASRSHLTREEEDALPDDGHDPDTSEDLDEWDEDRVWHDHTTTLLPLLKAANDIDATQEVDMSEYLQDYIGPDTTGLENWMRYGDGLDPRPGLITRCTNWWASYRKHRTQYSNYVVGRATNRYYFRPTEYVVGIPYDCALPIPWPDPISRHSDPQGRRTTWSRHLAMMVRRKARAWLGVCSCG